MDDKRIKDQLDSMSSKELRFTKEDRQEVFERINKMENKNDSQSTSLFSISKRFSILTASLLVVGLGLFLMMPSILTGNSTNGNVESNASEGVSQEDRYFTTLLTVKDENNRIPINLLLTYSKDKKMMKVLSIPRDTYAPIINKYDGTTLHDKLTHTYLYSSGEAENIRTTVSNLFDLTIDYYAVIDLETFSTLIESVDGIEYDLEEDIQVRAISQVAFELKKGLNHLTGEEVLALMMDATVERSLDAEDQLNLINSVINQAINVLPETQLKQIGSKIEGNIEIEQILENIVEHNVVQTISLKEGMIDTSIDGAYYIKFEEDYLKSVSEELTTFN